MDRRFSLRFESGERRGETIPIPPSGLTVGRKPGNSLQILDNSVSGQHAEIVVDGEGVLVRDVGSTNGTRVGNERVLEARLENGDHVLFGNVRLVFADGQSAASGDDDEIRLEDDAPPAKPAPLPARPRTIVPAPVARPAADPDALPRTVTVPALAAQPTQAGEALDRVSVEIVEKSKKRSLGAPIALAAIVLAGGAAAWFFLGRSKGGGESTRPVEHVAGDLLDPAGSFEGDERTWVAADNAPGTFLTTAAARRTGAQGIEAGLGANEWALVRSTVLRAGVDRELTAKAWFETRGDVEALLGVEFDVPSASDAPAPAPITAWAPLVHGASEWKAVEVHAPVPPGYSSARAVLLARSVGANGGGKVRVDDVSVVESASPAKPAASIESTGLFLHGDPPRSAHLFRVDRVLVSGLELTSADAAPGRDGIALAAKVDGPRIVVTGSGHADVLALRAESPLARGGIATIAGDGYRTHGGEFQRDGVESVLLGRGRDLVRLRFEKPCSVRGEPAGSALRIVAKLGDAPPSVSLQLDFTAEKTAAEDLAHDARNAEKQGALGAALASWRALLDRYPYEQALVDEAEATRARLSSAGLQELRDVRADLERARFFQLAQIFQSCRDRATSVGARYAGSEVEAEAKGLAQEAETDLAQADADHTTNERKRLTAMLAVLEAQKADGLASELRARLAKLEGGR